MRWFKQKNISCIRRMYLPRTNNNIQRYIQTGGDYISSSLLNQQYISSFSTITYSSLLYILSAANIRLSSPVDVESLTQAQLIDLAAAIQQRINSDNEQININNISIAQLLHQLNDPGGLQDQLSIASAQYNRELEEWQSTSTSIGRSNETILLNQRTYSSLLTSSHIIESQISDLRHRYSIAIYEHSTNKSLLDYYTGKYNEEMEAYISNMAIYNSTNSSIMTIVSEMNYYSSAMNAANSEYLAKSTLYISEMKAYLEYSTSLGNSNYILQSTQKYYSSLFDRKSTLVSQLMDAYGKSTLAGFDLQHSIIIEEYNKTIDAENSIIVSLDNAYISTGFYINALTLDPTNPTLQMLLSTSRALESSFRTKYESTHAHRMLLQSSQTYIRDTIIQAQLDEVDRLIAAADLDITNDIRQQRNLQATIDSLSSILRQTYIDEQTLTAAISDLSVKYGLDMTQYTLLDDKIRYCKNVESTISSQMITTMRNIDVQLGISTQYGNDYIAYLSNLRYYSTMEPVIKSTINGYKREFSSIIDQISTLDGLSTLSSIILKEQYSTFLNDGKDYYNYKTEDVNALMEQYIYDMRLYDLRARQCATDLTLKHSDNRTSMAFAWLQSQTLNITPSELGQLSQIRADLLSVNTAIDSFILNTLNPLERKFYDLVNMAADEKNWKGQLIQQRKNIFTSYEYPCLVKDIVPSSIISSSYYSNLSTLNILITQINSKIHDKNGKQNEINTILTQTNINTIWGILGKNWFSDVNRNAATDPIQSEPNTGNITTELGILPPIQF
jgi:hypothetical protein